MTYRSVIFQERMVEFEAFYLSAGKEARLANIKVEVFQRAISKKKQQHGNRLKKERFEVVVVNWREVT